MAQIPVTEELGVASHDSGALSTGPSAVDEMDDHSPTTSSSGTAISSLTTISSKMGDTEPIAIVGMGMRLPSGIRSGEQFWDFLINKGEGVCEVPASRYNIDAFYDPEKRNFVRTRQASFLQEDPAFFDAAFFSISKHEAARMDPQQRLLLEVVWECLENAGVTKWQGKEIGCYVGVFGEDWVELAYSDSQSIDRYHVLSTGPYALANRISYEYDIQGPSMTIQSGCSSSMLALHEACQGLFSGECSSAIVAGCNLILSPTMSTTMSDNLVISPDGKSKTFDAAADGYGRGEAINALYIKKLSDALADGDPIRAIIRATGTNSDGKTPVITAPGLYSQEALIRKTYAKAGIPDITQTPLFECHGTGTVKPNVGHSEGASGITSVIKSVLSLEHKVIPPNIYFNTPNPHVEWKEWNLRVPTEARPWPNSACERISVNCFGIGGANAHTVLDSASSFNLTRNQTSDCAKENLHILVVSARSEAALKKRVEDVTQYISETPSKLHDLAHTLGVRREHLSSRAFAVVEPCSANELSLTDFKLRKAVESKVIFVFTGQGAQWPGMGRVLIQKFQSFRDDIRYLDRVLQSLDLRPDWRLEDEISKESDTSRIDEAKISQPATTAIQIGLINIFSEWGLVPAAVVGHSSGEIAAACAAGALTARSAIITAYLRGVVAKDITRSGAMAAVAMSREELLAAEILTDGVGVACENSPHSVTISGDTEEIDSALARLKAEKPDVLCKRLKVDTAYHSDHMREVGQKYETLLSRYLTDTDSTSIACPLFSTVTGRVINDASRLDARYWRQNLESPVLFSTAIQALLRSDDSKAPNKVFIEIGPHGALSGPLREIFNYHSGGDPPVYLSTLDRKSTESASQLVHTAAHCFSIGINVDLLKINGPGNTLTDLPAYPWDHEEKYWNESRITKDWKFRKLPHHELLGSRVTGSTDFEPTWRGFLSLDNVPWLNDHLLQGELVFPGAAYVCMAGEAVQQLVPGSDSFSIRQIVLKAPLVLKEFERVEIITNLRPLRLNMLADSVWFEFSITAYDPQSQRWVKHSQGQVRAGADSVPSPREIRKLDRSVPVAQWYNILDRWGLSYRGPFQGLTDVSADPKKQIAAATIRDDRETHASRYLIHPSAIDSCLQLFSVAATAGLSYRFDQIVIPAGIEELYVSRGSEMMPVEVLGYSKLARTALGDAIMMNGNGEVALSMTRVVMAMHEDSGDLRSDDSHLAAEIEWRPWLEMVPSSSFFTPDSYDESYTNQLKTLVEISYLYILETADRIRNLGTDIPALENWKNWMLRQSSSTRDGAQSCCPDGRKWALLDSPARHQLINDLKGGLVLNDGGLAIVRSLKRNYDNCIDYLQGELSPLECLVSDGLLRDFYAIDRSFLHWESFLGLLGHQFPTMRVLEIGGGTGAATSTSLKGLRTPDGVSLFSRYTFTDISPEFTAAAAERFSGIDNLEFKRLDITEDVEQQGFEPHSFDLVIASNVIHATPSLKRSLDRVHDLIAPSGYFILHELDTEHPLIPSVFGVFPDWWAGTEDGRSETPFVRPERWKSELKSAGFTGIEAIVHDTLPPYRLCATMISRPLAHDLPKREICLLTDKCIPKWAMDVESELAQRGFSVSWTTLEEQQETPSQSDVVIISLLDIDSPFLDGMTEETFGLLQKFINASDERLLVWVTPSTQMSSPDPRYALTNGFFRSLRHESQMDLSVLEVDVFDSTAAGNLVHLCSEVRKSRNRSCHPPDFEFALKAGKIYTPRVHWRTPNQVSRSPDRGKLPRKIQIETYGLLDSLKWAPYEPEVLQNGYVEIETQYTALNFRDIMIAMGLLGTIDEVGLEGAGVITRVAPDVQGIKVGDRVAFGGIGTLRSSVLIQYKRCKRIPDELSMSDGATMMAVYSTVFYSLFNLANIREGQSILIHSACGGVGLAAIQVCRQVGAIVYATVGSEEKANYLVENWNIPRHRIFTSRSPEFVPGIMRETSGNGVDVVLNSLSGELLRASWMCVAEFGKMIELGKRDLMTHGKLDLEPFLLNRVYYGVDLIHIGEKRPEILERVRDECLEWYRQGEISPIRPVTIFPASDINLAFRHMQQGSHIGKVVVDMRELVKGTPSPPSSIDEIGFSSNGSYLLVGGMGGIGRTLSAWMVDNGARDLVYLSPSAGQSQDDRAFVRELEAQGCVVVTIAGSVINESDVTRAIQACSSPIKGVVQLSGRIKDRTFKKMMFEDWTESLDCKVKGTWNLHRALVSTPLDFFLMISSTCSMNGQTGQSNYAAANSFLDAFTLYRQQLGLPVSIINLGAVEHRGMVSRDSELLRYAKGLSLHLLQDKELIDGVRLAMGPRKTPSSPLGIGLSHTKPLSELAMKTIWPHDARFSMYGNLERSSAGSSGSGNKVLYSLMTRIQNDPRVLLDPETKDLIRAELGTLVTTYVPRAENMTAEEVAQMSLDSLMSVEVRRWIKTHLTLELSLIEITRAGTVGELARVTLDHLRAKYNLSADAETQDTFVSEH
ncbi:Fum1p [Penicillium herquei]|nr:Fum1p [Penicillium herquei]